MMAAMVWSALRICGDGIVWMAWTERPQPRVPVTSDRFFITKRPRTSVWIGRPLTRRPWNGVIFESD